MDQDNEKYDDASQSQHDQGLEPEYGQDSNHNQSILTSSKADDIRNACRDTDIPSLVTLATTDGGLLHDELRTIACMYLNSPSSSSNRSCQILDSCEAVDLQSLQVLAFCV
jgi:hypothetical protein